MSSFIFPKTKYELEFNQGSEYDQEEKDAVLRVFANNAPSCGTEVLAFEKEFAEFNKSTFSIAVGNATQGLEIAARAALAFSSKTVRDGSLINEIIVPSVSWISTAASASLAGATVKFADVINPTVCIDPESVKELVTDRTIAVIVVHLYGRPVDGLEDLAIWLNDRNIILIEDCAHAIGARYNNKLCGNIGDIGIFSFHQQKNMVTLGEGGMVVTNNSKLRELLIGYRSLCAKSYDPKGKYLQIDPIKNPMDHRYWMMDFADHGHNFRMLDMQAAVGRVQLSKVLHFNAKRSHVAKMLYEGLVNTHVGLIPADIDYHFPLSKEKFMWTLLNNYGIKAWNHYSPMHLASSYRSNGLGKVGDCPTAEYLFEQYVSLPVHPRLTDEAVLYMINAIKEISLFPRVERLCKTPLLNSLLALSNDSDLAVNKNNKLLIENDNVHKNNENPIVNPQWKSFQKQIKQCLDDGFFSSTQLYITRAPGRLDLMGGNDDYTGGLVFECTIAEATFVAAKSVSNNLITIRNRQLSDDDITIPVLILQKPNLTPIELSTYLKKKFPKSRWPLYVVGVLLWLQNRFPKEMFNYNRNTNEIVENGLGLSILVWSTVPLNRGVSSSASVEVAVMKAAAYAFGIDLKGELLATACQYIENEVCSSACGLMDQMAVTIGGPFMAMQCQPAIICDAPPLPSDLTIYAIDSGVSHEVSGIEYEAARAAAFMGYKMICDMEGLVVIKDTSGEIARYCDNKFNGYLANMSPSTFFRKYELQLPETISGQDYLDKFNIHVDPATCIIPEHIYHVRANTKYAVLENNRVTLFYQLLKGCSSSNDSSSNNSGSSSNNNNNSSQIELYKQLGELMYQSHDAYSECGLGSDATSSIVQLVNDLGPESGLFGAKITGGGAGGTVAILGLHSSKEIFQKFVVDVYTAQCKLIGRTPYVFVGSSPGADNYGVFEYKI